MACLGVETSMGEFRVVDLCFAGMAPGASAVGGPGEDEGMDVDEDEKKTEVKKDKGKGKWIAFVSGLDIASSLPTSAPLSSSSTGNTADTVPVPVQDDDADLRLQMLIEYLKGESGGEEDQKASGECQMLVVLGNSLDVPKRTADDAKNAVCLAFLSVLLIINLPFLSALLARLNLLSIPQKRYNQQISYDPAPLKQLSLALKDIASSKPIHLLPGPNDPASAILPQQPIPRAMFGFEPLSKGVVEGVFESETNPTWIDVGGDG